MSDKFKFYCNTCEDWPNSVNFENKIGALVMTCGDCGAKERIN